jgi:membrane-associated protein
VGFWIGRKGRERWSRGPGRLARVVRSVRSRTAHYLGGRPFLSVTIPRLISFVRTAMPLAAGMSGLSYSRYLRYELIGLVLWCALYVTMGVAVGEGWHWAAQMFGLDGTTALLLLVVAAGFVVRRRFIRWRARRG